MPAVSMGGLQVRCLLVKKKKKEIDRLSDIFYCVGKGPKRGFTVPWKSLKEIREKM